MAKEITAKVKLQCPAGQATPAPPVGPALGAHGVNIGAFVKEFNDKTRDQMGLIIPVEITVYKDRSFDFVMKSPPASVLLIKAAKIEKGGGNAANDAMTEQGSGGARVCLARVIEARPSVGKLVRSGRFFDTGGH